MKGIRILLFVSFVAALFIAFVLSAMIKHETQQSSDSIFSCLFVHVSSSLILTSFLTYDIWRCSLTGEAEEGAGGENPARNKDNDTTVPPRRSRMEPLGPKGQCKDSRSA